MNNKHIHGAILALTATTIMARAFDTGKGWKKDADGNLELKDGNPVYVDGGGNEMTVEPGTITRLNGEAKGHREAKEAAEAKLKLFDGIDAAKAREAFETLSKVDQSRLIDAGEVDKVREEVGKAFNAQIAERDKTIADLTANRDGLVLSNAFGSSKFLQDRISVPTEMFQATFGRHFKVEDGKVVPYGHDGQKLYSKKRAGEVADLDEAAEILVDGYAHKDRILKAPEHSGSNNGGQGGGRGGGRTMRRSDFEKLNAGQQSAAAQEMGKGELTLVD